jgi:predicted kinase
MKVNDRVIVKSNNDPYWIGTFLGMNSQIHGVEAPEVKPEDGSDMLICFGHVIPYSDEMVERLDKLTPEQQWKLLTAIKDWTGGGELVFVRGLPGSGKSTLAKKIAGQQGQVFSTDDYFCLNEDQEYRFDGSQLGKAHAWNQRRSLEAMKAGIPIVVIDNTNTTIRECRSYLPHIELAMKLGYKVSIEEPDTHWAFNVSELFAKGTHNVPEEHLQKMLNRYARDVRVEDIMFKK